MRGYDYGRIKNPHGSGKSEEETPSEEIISSATPDEKHEQERKRRKENPTNIVVPPVIRGDRRSLDPDMPFCGRTPGIHAPGLDDNLRKVDWENQEEQTSPDQSQNPPTSPHNPPTSGGNDTQSSN